MPAMVPSSVNVRMPPKRASGPVALPESLALDPDGRAAKNGDEHAGEAAEVEGHRIRIDARGYWARRISR